MWRSFKFRLWTTPTQAESLSTTLETHRRLYNACLAERKAAYESLGITVRWSEQSKRFKVERLENPFYAKVNFSSAQSTMRRLEKAFDGFFRRVQAGSAPGYPRFKSRDRFNSIEFPVHGNGIRLEGDRLRLQHVGYVRVKLHRPVVGTIKTLAIRRDVDKWYVIVTCDCSGSLPPVSCKGPIGIDVGLRSFLCTSDGDTVENPRYLKEALPELRRRQRRLCRKLRGGSNRKKARKAVAKAHSRVANLRREHHHKVALNLVRRYGLIAVESLSIKIMLKNDRLSRAISDVAWGNFLLTLRSKAESAGVAFVEVDARGTSQECSACHDVVPKDLSQRWHRCDCGCSLNRDENAARNILARALQARTGPAERNVTGYRKRAPRSRCVSAAE